MKILEIKHLCQRYKSFSLDNVSFQMESDMIMGYIGRNGAGKTTTMKSILNLVHADSGSVLYFGQPLLDNEDKIKERLGFATGGAPFYQRKTLAQIAACTKSFYSNWDDDAYKKYIKLFNLDESKKLRELSEGMKVKFSLTTALSHHAELLILDEPTSGLDPVSRDERLDICEYLSKEGVAILFSTHITSDLEKCAGWITYIKQGKIVASKPKADFIAGYPNCKSLEDIMVKIERQKEQGAGGEGQGLFNA